MAEIKSEDTAYAIPENPQYDPIIRKLKVSDPAHAETVFNPLLQQIINNVHAVKVSSDGKAPKAVCTKVVLTTNKWTGSAAPFTQTISVNGVIKTNTEESLLYIAPDLSSSEMIANCEVIAFEIQNNGVIFKATKKPSSNVSFLVVNAGIVGI